MHPVSDNQGLGTVFYIYLGGGYKAFAIQELEVLESGGEEKVKTVLGEFGPALVRMVEPVFAVQAEALKKAPWMTVRRFDWLQTR